MRKFIFLAGWLLSFLPTVAQEDQHNVEVTRQLEIFNNVYRQLDRFYVDTLSARKNVDNAILYMLAQLDPYTEYYAEDRTDDLKQLTTGKYAGIGSMISISKSADRCIIAEPYKGMPAAKAGLRRGDVILNIGGVDMGVCGKQKKQEYSQKVSNALRGEPGTKFKILVNRPHVADSLTFEITRATVELPSISYSGILEDSIGYVLLNGYTENTSRDLRRAVTDLKEKGARRLVLDLRANGGGLMMEAVNVVNLFIPRGLPVVSTKGKLKELGATYKTRLEPLDTEMPLVILTDFGTASSAEITSGALQDYDRAVVVGRRTYGKGLVQQSRPVGGDAVLKLTTSKYYIPSGRCIQAYEFEDGMPKHLPDSLSKLFHTAAGREVRDGGGITPDVMVVADTLPGLLAQLEISDVLFDYAVKYRNTHREIAGPLAFHLTDEEYADFIAYLKAEKFVYDRQSRKALDLLRQIARREGYAEVAKAEFDALEAKLVHHEEDDYQRWGKEIRRMVEMAILQSYYFEEGAIAHCLSYDKDLQEGLRILRDEKKYRDILASPKEKSK